MDWNRTTTTTWKIITIVQVKNGYSLIKRWEYPSDGLYFIQGAVELLLVASRAENVDKRHRDWPLSLNEDFCVKFNTSGLSEL